MLDLDPRDYDSRDEERHTNTPSRGGRGSCGLHDRDHDWRTPSSTGSSGVATSMRFGVCTPARGSITSITGRCISSSGKRRAA